MSEKLDKLRASLEKEKERRIKINNRISSMGTDSCICGKTVPVSVLPPTTARTVRRWKAVRFPSKICRRMAATLSLPPGTGICLNFRTMTVWPSNRKA